MRKRNSAREKNVNKAVASSVSAQAYRARKGLHSVYMSRSPTKTGQCVATQGLNPPTRPTVPWSKCYQISLQNESLDAAHESAPHAKLSDDLRLMHSGPTEILRDIRTS